MEPSWPDYLTPRERDTARMLAVGYTCREIAEAHGIALKTTETHRQRVLNKIGLRTTVALARWAIREGLVSGAEADDAPGCRERDTEGRRAFVEAQEAA